MQQRDDCNQAFAGKKWTTVWAAGQGVGASKAIEPVATIVDQLAREYAQAVTRMNNLPWTA